MCLIYNDYNIRKGILVKYFVVTDVHSYYDEMIEALNKAGYDSNNPEHFFVSCGDLFDRGLKSKECLDYVMSLPKDRRVLIMGNHEQNLIDLIDGSRPFDESDRHNRTLKTMRHLCGNNSTKIENILNGVRENVELKSYLDELVDFYETEHFFFVHGWYPWSIVEEKDGKDIIKIHYANPAKWWKARWMCGFLEWGRIRSILEKYSNVSFPDEKITVCGHCHTSYGHACIHNLGKEFPSKGERWKKHCCFDPFIDKNIIALDACSALTHMCNCVVLEEPSGAIVYVNHNSNIGDSNEYI